MSEARVGHAGESWRVPADPRPGAATRMAAAAPWRVALGSGAFAAAVSLSANPWLLPLLVVVAVLVALRLFVDHRRAMVVVVIAACAAGGWRGISAAAVDRGPASVAGHLGAGATVLRGSIADSGVPGREDTVVVAVTQLATAGGTWPVSGSVVVQPRTAVDVLPGDTVDVQTTTLRAPPRRPGSLSAVALERVGVTAVAPAAQVAVLGRGGPSPARLAQQLRRALAAAVTRVLPEPEATLVLGISFGIHGRLTGVVRTSLQDAGLIHIVAVSGLKVVMVAGLVQSLAGLRLWSPRRRIAVTVLVIALYLVLSGSGAAALRSSLMVSAGLLLSRDGRRPHSFALLGLCAALLLAVEPPVATDVGFQLSFLGTAGILMLAGPIARRLPGPRLLADPFAVTVAAQLATAPVTAGTFGVLSLVGPVANAMVLPLLPLSIVAGGAGSLLTVVPGPGPALGWLGLQLAALVARVTLAIAQGTSALPFAAIHIQLWPATWTIVELIAATAAGLVWLWRGGHRSGAGTGLPPAGPPSAAQPDRLARPRPVLWGAAAALATGLAGTVVAAAATPPGLRVTVLDVGNGVAVLVRPPGGGTVLVDGGGDGAALLTALGRVMSPLDRHLDAVVLTAADRATAAAIPGLIGHYDVSALVVSQPLPAALQTAAASLAGTGTTVVSVGAGAWQLGGLTARCAATGPAPAAPCALQLSAGRAAAVITGNVAPAAQDELAAVEASRLSADLLVGPTTTAPGAALLDAVRPSLLAVPARRAPPGLGAVLAQVAVTGRDSDLEYDAVPGGGFASPTG